MGTGDKFVTLTPLGGLGEIGLNCMVLETENSMVVIDCGIMFPEDFLFGVDVVIPRLDFIIQKKDKLKGIVLTHGHEDHIGALPWLMPYVDAPILVRGLPWVWWRTSSENMICWSMCSWCRFPGDMN